MLAQIMAWFKLALQPVKLTLQVSELSQIINGKQL